MFKKTYIAIIFNIIISYSIFSQDETINIRNYLRGPDATIKFRNFSFDYSRTFHSEGQILNVYKDSIDLSFSPEFPYRINNFKLIFVDNKGVEYPCGNLLEYDTQKNEPAFDADDFWCGSNPIVKESGSGKIRLYLKGIKGTTGNTMVFGAGHRIASAFTIYKSSDIGFTDINIYHKT